MIDREDKLRQAAIVLLTLDDEAVERILDQFSVEDASQLRRMMVGLDSVDGDEERRILSEFLRFHPVAADRPDSGAELALSSAHHPTNVVKAGRPAPTVDDQTPFRFLHAARGEKITPFLAGEHPQTIAVVVSHLPDDRAAAVLSQLDGALQADVVRRLIDLDQADPEMLREVEVALESRMLEQALAERRHDTGMVSVARILDAAEPALRRGILSNLARHDRSLAERICPKQFEFDELWQLDESALATVLASAGVEVTRLALAGADAELVGRILASLTAAEAKKMRRLIERIGPIRLSDVEEAQREIVRVAHQLVLEGMIDLPSQNGVLAVV
jgi:flagellar motor switch protein FliG